MLHELLQKIEELDESVTEGPWQSDGDALLGATYKDHNATLAPFLGDIMRSSDAEFIALARTFTPAASRALRDVLKTLDQYLVKFDQDNMEDHIVHGIVHELRNKIQDQFRAQNEYHKTP